MAQTLTQILRTVTTDFTDPVTKKRAQQSVMSNMAAVEDLSERDLKAGQVVALAYFLSSGVTIAAGTNYTGNTYPNTYRGLADQALAFFNGILPRLDLREKNMLDLVLTANAAIYANGIAGLLDINSGLAEVKRLRNFSAEELDRMIYFLRLKTGI